MPVKDLRRSPMMGHLLDALERGEDIGHYGRLTFAMIAHRFLDRDDLVDWLAKDGDTDEGKAKALVQQVEERDFNPPSRRRILEWQAQQDFPICPTPDDPTACNPYRELDMPQDVLEDIEEYREQRFDANASSQSTVDSGQWSERRERDEPRSLRRARPHRGRLATDN